ncbi:protein lifeguard 1 isoform X2 [Drosophila serrata]|uniref:protein lifeguard 1 isoform X2 n=1 Tax=Drosophila serrata TaxID=7274 RepID=UPI000A1D012B|nr:protein lifeguard 1 isoform X2 [Drosophila serrata]XP_020814977.1 protein lifeguard 1 isoform X2 [Drosophila serrata]XP_020814978.1 protein lifeguard 1 isoform X2 [Drosophila serrata]
MQDPNQQYNYGGGYPPQGGYGGGGYPPQGPPQGYPPYAQGGAQPYPQGPYGQPYGQGPPPGGYAPQPGFIQPPPPTGGYGAYDDPESQPKNFSFDDQSIRRGFIRKVYLILMGQLLVTFGAVALFVYHQGTKDFAHRNIWLFWVALGVMLVTMLSMACCESVRRQTPTNFIFLGLFTAAQSFLMGVSATRYAPNEVLLAVGITAAVCLALTLFAWQTKYDFTMMGGVLIVCMVVFLIFGIVAMFMKGKIITLVYASIGALLFSVYLIYDTQLMMGGEHKYSISPEEYIFAALNLYLDIINIFMYILTIIGASRD